MTASHISPDVARRIDRLAWRAHAFHRYAHHPLCQPYHREVLRVGKQRLCKGCSLLTLGCVVGLLSGALVRPSLAVGGAALGLAIFLGGLSLGLRLPKVLGRALPGAGVGLGMWAGWVCALASLASVAALALFFRRRGADRSSCATCRERSARVCSGFTRIVRRERAFRRRADRWLDELR